jgi:hypothetical protein
MRTTKSLAMLLFLTLPLTAGCQSRSIHEATDRAAGSPYSSTAATSSSPATVEDMTMGKKVGENNTITSDDQANKFAPGEPIYLAVQVDAPAGAPVQVAWYDDKNEKLGEDQKTVAKHDKHLSFQAKDAAAWPQGDYRAEVWVGNQKVGTQQFTIADRNS